MGPACSFRCHPRSLCDDFQALWSSPMGSHLGRADQIRLHCREDFVRLESSHGLFESLSCMELLTLSWPIALQPEAEGQDDDYWRIEDGFSEGAESLLLRCMPSNGLPVQHLECVVISGHNIRCVIPAKLPDLEELVISAEGQLQLFFEDVEATAAGLNKFHVFGQPLLTNGMDTVKVSHVLAGRGLILDAASASEDWKYIPAYLFDVKKGSTCTYMRSVVTESLSMHEAFSLIQTFISECRCECCELCLERSGRFTRQ